MLLFHLPGWGPTPQVPRVSRSPGFAITTGKTEQVGVPGRSSNESKFQSIEALLTPYSLRALVGSWGRIFSARAYASQKGMTPAIQGDRLNGQV